MSLANCENPNGQKIEIISEADIVLARSMVREVATSINFSMMNKTRIATAVSELARNTLVHGGGGRMEVATVSIDGQDGIRCVFVDDGPGIANIEQAMADGYSTGNSMGQGLPGAFRLVDDIQIDSEVDRGTRVEIVKWK